MNECVGCGVAGGLVCGGLCLTCCREQPDWCEMCGSFHAEPLVCQVSNRGVQATRPTIDELLQQGAQQVSRKYRIVARLPVGMTGLDALRERSPERYADVMRRAEQWAADEYRRDVACRHGDYFELTVEEFNEFLEKTGRRAWTPKGEACEHCRSLGHTHAKDCPNNDRVVTE